MKKKSLNQKFFNLLLILFFLFIIICGIKGGIDHYSEYKDEKNKDKAKQQIANTNVWKKSVLEKNDGWYYTLNAERITINSEYKYDYFFDGCNIKYSTLKDNYVKVDLEDEKYTTIPANPPFISTSYRSKDGNKTENEEQTEINKILNSGLKERINNDDLGEIKFVNFNSDDVVSLWNSLDSLQYTNERGKYEKYNQCEIIKNENKKNHFQIGIVFSYANIKKVRIDYVYEDGTYLTDIINQNKATSSQKKLYENIKNIEKEVMNDGNFYLKNKFANLKRDSFYKELFELFGKIEGEKS